MKFNLFKHKEKSLKSDSVLNADLNKKNQEKSKGRSMVEMLGVLAIIGVLSIGGISGYTLAMRKYRANEFVNTLTKYASIVYIGFHNYMIKNPDSVDVSDNLFGIPYASYGCKATSALFGETHYETSCPYYRLDAHRDFLAEAGLGGYPNGVSRVSTRFILMPDDNFSTDRVEVFVVFTDKELCKTVATLLSGYGSSIDTGDGNDCVANNTLYKAFPVE